MEAFGAGPDISPSFLIKGSPWASLGAATVVDLGGSNGAVSVAIAESNPSKTDPRLFRPRETTVYPPI